MRWHRFHLQALVGAALVVGVAWAQKPAPQSPPTKLKSNTELAEEFSSSISRDLAGANELVRTLPDNRTRDRLMELLERIELNSLRLKGLVKPIPTGPAPKTPLIKTDFDKLLKSLKQEAFDDGRFALLKAAANTVYFTSEQARQLVAVFTFSDGQKKAAILLHARLVDPVNFPSVVAAMTFDSDRQEVLRSIARP